MAQMGEWQTQIRCRQCAGAWLLRVIARHAVYQTECHIKRHAMLPSPALLGRCAHAPQGVAVARSQHGAAQAPDQLTLLRILPHCVARHSVDGQGVTQRCKYACQGRSPGAKHGAQTVGDFI